MGAEFINNNLKIIVKSPELTKEIGRDNVKLNIIESGVRYDKETCTLAISDIIVLDTFQVIHEETETTLFSVCENKLITADMFNLVMQGKKHIANV